MAYVITNGSSYIQIGSDNRPCTTKVVSQARTFESRVRAENFCSCLPGAYKNLGFYVITDGDILPHDLPQNEKPDDRVISRPTDHSVTMEPAEMLDERFIDIDYILSEISRFEDFLAKFQSQATHIRHQQIFAEAQLFDIEHAAEFTQLNACEGFKLYKKLREARLLRRKCKDALAALSFLNECNATKFLDNQTSSKIEHFNKRSFTPRALPELFD